MNTPLSHMLFLPVDPDDVPEPIWKVVYADQTGTMPVYVCAPDEDTAVMRAGMKRSEMLKLDRYFWGPSHAPRKWTRVSVEVVEAAD